jgi:hypothetical protein
LEIGKPPATIIDCNSTYEFQIKNGVDKTVKTHCQMDESSAAVLAVEEEAEHYHFCSQASRGIILTSFCCS